MSNFIEPLSYFIISNPEKLITHNYNESRLKVESPQNLIHLASNPLLKNLFLKKQFACIASASYLP